MRIYVGKDNLSKCYDLSFCDGFDDFVLVNYYNEVVYPDSILLEFYIEKKMRKYYYELHSMASNMNIDYINLFKMTYIDHYYRDKILNLDKYKKVELLKNFSRCGIEFNSSIANFSTHFSCEPESMKNGMRNPLFIDYLKKRIKITIEFILSFYEF